MDSCFFKNFSSKECGISSSFQFGTSVVQLRLCDNDTSHHLKSLNVARGLTEGVLISARAGLFAYDPNILVCPAHRSSLGLRWRRSRLCVFPGHTGKSKPDRSLSLQMCKNIFVRSGTVVPVGGGVCKKCREYYYKHIRITGGDELFEDFQKMNRKRMRMGARRAEQTSHQAIQGSTSTQDSVMKETDEGRQPMLNTQHEVAIPVKDVGNSERDRNQRQDLPNSHLSGIHDGINILINSGTSEIGTHNSCEMTSYSCQPNDTSEATESLVTRKVLCSVKREFFPDAIVSENDTHNSFEMTSGNTQTNNTSEPTESLVTREVICSVKREFLPDTNVSENDTHNSFEMSLHSGQTHNTSEPTESLVTGEVICSVKREFHPGANVSENFTHNSFEMTSYSILTNEIYKPKESLVTGEVPQIVKHEFSPDTNVSDTDTHTDLPYCSVVMETSVGSSADAITNNRKRHVSLGEATFHTPSKQQRRDVEEGQSDCQRTTIQLNQDESFVTDGCHGDTWDDPKEYLHIVNGQNGNQALPIPTGTSYSEAKCNNIAGALYNAYLDQSKRSVFTQTTNDLDE